MRETILELEVRLQKFGDARRQIQQVQESLIMGRVNDARERISKVLLEWPMR